MWETIILGLALVALVGFAIVVYRRRHEEEVARSAADRKARGEAEAYQTSRYWQQ